MHHDTLVNLQLVPVHQLKIDEEALAGEYRRRVSRNTKRFSSDVVQQDSSGQKIFGRQRLLGDMSYFRWRKHPKTLGESRSVLDTEEIFILFNLQIVAKSKALKIDSQTIFERDAADKAVLVKRGYTRCRGRMKGSGKKKKGNRKRDIHVRIQADEQSRTPIFSIFRLFPVPNSPVGPFE